MAGKEVIFVFTKEDFDLMFEYLESQIEFKIVDMLLNDKKSEFESYFKISNFGKTYLSETNNMIMCNYMLTPKKSELQYFIIIDKLGNKNYKASAYLDEAIFMTPCTGFLDTNNILMTSRLTYVIKNKFNDNLFDLIKKYILKNSKKYSFFNLGSQANKLIQEGGLIYDKERTLSFYQINQNQKGSLIALDIP